MTVKKPHEDLYITFDLYISEYSMKIVFFGTANVALPILEELNRHHQILAVVTQPDAKAGRKREFAESPVSVLATEMKHKLLKPEKVKGNQEFYQELKNLGADIFVVVAYGKILPPEIIYLPPLKSINVHFAPLPRYRGPSPIQAALMNGDEQTGTSIFILDEQVDHGPMLAQQIVNIDPDDNFLTLSTKLAQVSAKVIMEALEDYASGKITPLPQDDEAATHTKIITKQDGQINWQKSARKIYNQFRAFYPWPGIWTRWNGKVLKVTDCKATDLRIDAKLQIPTDTPGTVSKGGIVACGGDTYLQINSLQLEGKNETNISDFLNGYREFVGSKLLSSKA